MRRNEAREETAKKVAEANGRKVPFEGLPGYREQARPSAAAGAKEPGSGAQGGVVGTPGEAASRGPKTYEVQLTKEELYMLIGSVNQMAASLSGEMDGFGSNAHKLKAHEYRRLARRLDLYHSVLHYQIEEEARLRMPWSSLARQA